MLEWIYEKNLLNFMSDVMVERYFLIFLKDLKCKFTNLSLYLKNLNNEIWGIFFVDLS